MSALLHVVLFIKLFFNVEFPENSNLWGWCVGKEMDSRGTMTISVFGMQNLTSTALQAFCGCGHHEDC